MSKSNPKVLVVGATGRVASLVVPALISRGATVRALLRDPAKAASVRAGGAEVVVGDLRDRCSLDKAVNGVDGVFHIGPAFAPDEAVLGVAMADAAKRAGVRRFVFSSVIQPTLTRLANHASKIPVEDALYASGMQYTILHPTNFMQNIASGWPTVLEKGIFAEPFPTTKRVARVDYRDVAEVAAIALTGDTLAYGAFDLCADGMPNREDIVAIISDVLGRRIEAVELSFDDWAATAKLPYDDRQKQFLRKVQAHYAEHGSGGNSLTLRAILGRAPRSLRGFIEELASATR